MAVTEIWHNPRCTKSRQTLALLEERGLEILVRRYLEDAPTEAELRDALDMLNLPAIAMMRRGEARFKDLGLTKDSPDDMLLTAMAQNPILIERPIVLANGKAAIGRPPETVLEIL